MMSSPWGRRLLLLAAALVAIQLIPIPRTNPPVEAPITAPAKVVGLFQRACYNCHSNESVWPWYSYVAPASWLIAFDVSKGRSEFNFSSWGRLAPEKRRKLVKKIWKEINESDMPPWYYLPLHPEARLSADERSTIEAWATANQ